MPSKLPPDFDAARYAAAYPDVALSGLDPTDHYQLFGRLLGRDPSPAHNTKMTEPTGKARSEVRAAAPAEESPPSPRQKPIVDRPPDFDPSESIVQPAPPRQGAKGGRFTLAELCKDGSAAAAAAAAAYAQIFRIDGPAGKAGPSQETLFRGSARFETMWLVGTRMRLIVADGFKQGAIIRAFQADAGEPGQLHPLAPGALLPKRGPVLIEFELRNRLMPVLLELSDAGDEGRTLGLLPFPSLLPGGLHGAELRALQPASNPVPGFWALSDVLLRDLLSGKPSLSNLTTTDSNGARAVDSDTEQWLAAVFGFEADCGAKAGRWTVSRAHGTGAKLLLPPDSIPTISVLVARSLAGRAARSTAPFLVAESETLRPRWSVALPAEWDTGGLAPVLEHAADEQPSAPVHAAIAIRTPVIAEIASNKPTASPKKSRSARKISVLLDASDAERAKTVALALKSTIGADLDLAVRPSGNESTLRTAIDSVLGANAWRAIAKHASLAEAAAQARHGFLLTISDRVDLGDPATLDGLAEMLKDKNAASASCVLLHEVSLKKQKVLQPATGGLFPARVSFAVSPSLTFFEPDVLQALPNATYPVVANTLKLTLWKTSSLTGLPLPALPDAAEDIGIGLALGERGLLSLCTTKFRARLHGPYTPRDAIDPLGLSRLTAQNWQALLDRVTTLQQLF